MTTNFHTNAATLIVTAAEKSGLLQEIAQALRYADTNNPTRGEGCLACTLRSALVDAFVLDLIDENHDAFVTNILEIFYSEGFVIPACSEEEVAPYLGVSSSPSTPSTQT